MSDTADAVSRRTDDGVPAVREPSVGAVQNPGRGGWRTTGWTIAVIVAVIAALGIVWPVKATDGNRHSVPSFAAGGTEVLDGTPLVACPRAHPGAATLSALAGVEVPCLGSAQLVDVGAALAGSPVPINLWASWCAPCRDEMPVLDAYARSPGAVPVVGMDVQDRSAAAVALLADLGVGYPSFGPADAVAAALVAPHVLPLSYLVRADGTVHRIGGITSFTDPGQVRDSVMAYSR